MKIGCFTSPSIRGISEKQSFLVHFQPGIISYKKKIIKKYRVYVAVVLVITLSRLATCPVSSSCSVTHEDGGHLLSAVSMTARIFSALATWKQCCFSVSHSYFFEYLIKLLQIYRAVAVMAANGVCKITCEAIENWLRYQQKTLRRRCYNVGSVLCINNLWSIQWNFAKFTGQLP